MAGGGNRNNQVVPAQNQQRPPLALSEDTVKSLLEVQTKELTLRSKEMDLRIRELDNNSAHAEKILAAQERDRKEERTHDRGTKRDRLVFAAIVVVVLLAFAALGMQMGKEALVKDVLQIILGGVAGAFGGYGYASKTNKDAKDENGD